MFNAIKEEIANKKRNLEEHKMVTSSRKYFKRGELDQIMYGKKSAENESSLNKNDVTESKNEASSSRSQDMDDAPTLPRQEVQNFKIFI